MTTTPTRAAIWARVSTDDQTTANQLDQLRQWAARRGYDVAIEYVVTGSAWTGKHRTQLDDALRAARLGQFDVMLVWSLDRLSREGVEATLGILRRFRQHGCAVISLQEPWTDTADPHLAELLSSIFAWMARAESDRRSERIKAGLARKKAAGESIGRKKGAKDSQPRKRSGYVKRWEHERELRA